MEKSFSMLFVVLMLSMVFSASCFASGVRKSKKAIVLVMFGTSYPSALVSITNIQKTVQMAFHGVEVRIAFTSDIVIKIWHKRQGDAEFLDGHKQIPKEILHVKAPPETIADLRDEGYQTIIVQPTHICDGEGYTKLCSYVNRLNLITTPKKKYSPLVKLVMGRPVLGKHGIAHDYHDELDAAVKTLAADVELAMKNESALVYMGHGNEFYRTSIYAEFQQAMRKTYPEASIFIGTMKGSPSLEEVVFAVTHHNIKKIMLKPMMIVAGDHANNDMASDAEDSWKSVFEKEGISVSCVIQGLGENLCWDEIYVDHIKDVAWNNDITL